jgi:hypothetical protein
MQALCYKQQSHCNAGCQYMLLYVQGSVVYSHLLLLPLLLRVQFCRHFRRFAPHDCPTGLAALEASTYTST